MAGAPLLIGRYTKCPIDLFRIQAGVSVRLREFAKQKAMGRASFDLHVRDDGLVHPATTEFFEGPNGMSLRPGGPVLGEIIANFRGGTVYCIPMNVELPEDLVLLHEHTDHYSLQTKVPIKLAALNKKLTDFLNGPSVTNMTKEEYFRRFPIIGSS